MWQNKFEPVWIGAFGDGEHIFTEKLVTYNMGSPIYHASISLEKKVTPDEYILTCRGSAAFLLKRHYKEHADENLKKFRKTVKLREAMNLLSFLSEKLENNLVETCKEGLQKRGIFTQREEDHRKVKTEDVTFLESLGFSNNNAYKICELSDCCATMRKYPDIVSQLVANNMAGGLYQLACQYDNDGRMIDTFLASLNPAAIDIPAAKKALSDAIWQAPPSIHTPTHSGMW